jgi:hypothetical protein
VGFFSLRSWRILLKVFSEYADKQIKVFVGRFEAIASHIKQNAKTLADPVANFSNGVFVFIGQCEFQPAARKGERQEIA